MELFERLKYIFFPNRCVRCNRGVDRGEVLCEDCLEDWEKEKLASCNYCGRSHISCSCLLKRDEENRIPVVYHLAEYKRDSIAGDMIIALKRRQNSDICRFLANELCKYACDGQDFSDAVITFVPRRREVIRETGSDQAMEIAKAVCELSGKELFFAFKRKGRADQKKLDVEGRKRNASSSYALIAKEDEISGRSFFIFDDVITTGSTVLACAELLLDKGASKVTAVSIARRT